MEYQKITNLFGNISDKIPKFFTKKMGRGLSSVWIIIVLTRK